MRLAVLSDIHGNLQALEAVTRDLAGLGADRVVGLGDMVGYGPQPQECLDLIRERGMTCLVGNHEQGLFDPALTRWFNPRARISLEVTRSLLAEEAMEYLATLPEVLDIADCRLVHGAPPDSVATYLNQLSDGQLTRAMEQTPGRLAAVGHTHYLELIIPGEHGIVRRTPGAGTISLAAHPKAIVNAGAVGQPRDGDPRAKYVIWDSDQRELTVRKVAYDFPTTQRLIRAGEMPDVYAELLGGK